MWVARLALLFDPVRIAWKDFHPNGQLASHGIYDKGKEVGTWRFWTPDGKAES